MQYKRIPKYLNSLPTFLWWEADDMLAFFIPFLVGMFLGYFWTGMAGGMILAYWYSKSKDSTVKGYFGHYFYWVGLRNGKKGLPSYARKLIR